MAPPKNQLAANCLKQSRPFAELLRSLSLVMHNGPCEVGECVASWPIHSADWDWQATTLSRLAGHRAQPTATS